MPATPDAFLNRDLLRHLAGEQSFASGERCLASGRVQRMRAASEKVSAQVVDASTHRVKLWRRQGQLCYECDCEAGRASAFCQHCVAVGLAWITRTERPTAGRKPDTGAKAAKSKEDRTRKAERQRLAQHLETLGSQRLVSLVLEATDYDEILRRRLLLETIGVIGVKPARATKQAGSNPDFAAYRELLRQAVNPNGHVDFHALPDFAQGIEEAIAPLHDLLSAGWHGEVIALAEFVLVGLDAASDRVDLGDGLFNRIYDELQRVHLAACRGGTPVAELAARLLSYELDGGLGIFNNAVNAYAEMLGEEGTAVWRTLLVREWRATRQTSPHSLDHRRFQAQMLMERLARETRDLEALIALKEADLEGVHDRIGLAEWLLASGRVAEAIRCAERAAELFEKEPEKSVWRGFLMTAYQAAGRPEDAVRLAWVQFCDASTPESFRELKSLVLEVGSADWLEWREKALARVRYHLGQERSPIVELLIEEAAYDEAWQEASLGTCRDDLRLLLAERREKDHPLDSLRTYQQQIGLLLTKSQRADYREPVELTLRVRKIFRLHRMEDEYHSWFSALRSGHRQKRAFLRLLEAAGA